MEKRLILSSRVSQADKKIIQDKAKEAGISVSE